MSVIERPDVRSLLLCPDEEPDILSSLSATFINKGQSVGPYFWEGNVASGRDTIRRLYVESGRTALILTTFSDNPHQLPSTVVRTLDANDDSYFKIPSLSAWMLRVSQNAWEPALVSGLDEAIYGDMPAQAIERNQASVIAGNTIRFMLPPGFRAAIAR